MDDNFMKYLGIPMRMKLINKKKFVEKKSQIVMEELDKVE
jgi:hypothetical protein